jgi:hypothetical protein
VNNICAIQGCSDPSYTGNALTLQSPIGCVIVYFCHKHIAEVIHVNMVAGTARTDQDIEQSNKRRAKMNSKEIIDSCKSLGENSEVFYYKRFTVEYGTWTDIEIKDKHECVLLTPPEALALLSWLQEQRSNIEALQEQENTK